MSKHRQTSPWRRWHKAVMAAAAVVLATGIVLSGTPATLARAGSVGDVRQVLQPAGPGRDAAPSPPTLPSLSTDLRTPVHRTAAGPVPARRTASLPPANTAQAPPPVVESAPSSGLLPKVLGVVGGLL